MRVSYLIFVLTIFLPSSSYADFSPFSDFNEMKRKADIGNTFAQYKLGLYFWDKGQQKSALLYLRDACESGEQRACEFLNNNAATTGITNEGIESTLEDAYELYNSKRYRHSFIIFKNYCSNHNSANACLMEGLCYAEGNGTKRDPHKAYQILSSDILKDNIRAKWWKAQILEYDLNNGLLSNIGSCISRAPVSRKN